MRIPSEALEKAIDTVDGNRLRVLIKHYCASNPALVRALEDEWLVRGKAVIRYHADTDSEDDVDSENESSEDEHYDSDEDEDDRKARRNAMKTVKVDNDEATPRYAQCEHCEEEFDVTTNERGDCLWHPGMPFFPLLSQVTKAKYSLGAKEVDDESSMWDDHDPDCHGDPSYFVDDPNYAEGFMWDCCEKSGDDEGCKSTKHKADVNVIIDRVPEYIPPATNRKRKADDHGSGNKRRR
jgi:hypothetical protein